MSIFTRSSPTPQTKEPPTPQATAQKSKTQNPSEFAPPPATTAPAAAPGVVPPPAAPIYSMRPADGASATETARVTTDVPVKTKVDVEARVRAAAQTTRPAASSAQAVPRKVQQPAVRIAAPTTPVPAHRGFDPSRAAQAGLLNLAWRWQESGSPIRAIHAYMELLCRYPDSAGAEAAVADLVALSDKLAEQGQFHTALAIYDQLEELLA